MDCAVKCVIKCGVHHMSQLDLLAYTMESGMQGCFDWMR